MKNLFYQTILAQKLKAYLLRLALSVVMGILAVGVALLGLLTITAPLVQAAPPGRPLFDIITGTTVVTHTAAMTHQMTVFADGRITDQFLTDNTNVNQIGRSITTTIAVLFDQHPSDTVDIGAQGDFSATTPITLYTFPHNHYSPIYTEDTSVVYASRVLSYQITQRTLATTTNNCVIMELEVSNTGAVTLTGGKLLYLVDIQVGRASNGDRGHFYPTHRFVYQTDHNTLAPSAGYAAGIFLLQGDFRGYGVDGTGYLNPTSDLSLMNEMITPKNAITDDPDDVSWLVANIPAILPGQSTMLAFGFCARTALGDDPSSATSEAITNIITSITELAKLSTVKTASPIEGSSIVAGEYITYTIALSSSGSYYVDNIVITDTIPFPTRLITYSVSQGSIAADDQFITATIGRLYPTSDTVTMTIVVASPISSPHGAIITNQAFIQSEPIVTVTNVVTHQVINAPVLTAVKYAFPAPTVQAGQRLSYTIVISSGGQGYATDVTISDTLPINTEFVSDSIDLYPPGLGVRGTAPPILVNQLTLTAGQSITITYAVTVTKPITNGAIITNTAWITGFQVVTPAAAVVTNTVIAIPAIHLVKDGPITAALGSLAVFTFSVTNIGDTLLRGVAVWDNLASWAAWVSGDGNGNNWLDLNETWIYTAGYTIPPSANTPLTNIGFVTATDPGTQNAAASATHTTNLIGDNSVLTITKTGPLTATIGQRVVYTFTVAHAGGDGSPVQTVAVTDTVAGVGYYYTGDNGDGRLDSNETWVYTAAHTITPTDTSPLINIATLSGKNLRNNNIPPTSATHITYLTGYNPKLALTKTGPLTAAVGQRVIYTFTVAYAGGDGTPVHAVTVTDTVAGPGYYYTGDVNGNSLLEPGETWVYTAAYTVTPTAPNPLVNTATVTAKDKGNEEVSAVATHTMGLTFDPQLAVAKFGPPSTFDGDVITYTFFVINVDNLHIHELFDLGIMDINIAAIGDGSAISITLVTDTLAGITRVSGDNNGNNWLDGGEAWRYRVIYTVSPSDTTPLRNTVMARGLDRGGGVIVSATDTVETPIIRYKKYFFPIIFKN